MNILFVSHSTFTGSSALHVYNIASELARHGFNPAIAVPEDPGTVAEIGVPEFPIGSYADAFNGTLGFPNGAGPDLVHAFTPRERVRRITEEVALAYGCPYVVHLEDNEEAIVATELGMPFAALARLPPSVLDPLVGDGQAHPHRVEGFLRAAAGCTVVVEALLNQVPPGVPAIVLQPGIDEFLPQATGSRENSRRQLGVGPKELIILYTGSIHATNRDEMFSLYLAVALGRRDGLPLVLVKTGWNWSDPPDLDGLKQFVCDVGWISRDGLADLLDAADILVQPGKPGAYTDYRFPSKLPDYLASGRPVVLPRSNLGLLVQDGREALLLERGDAVEIHARISELANAPELRRRIGEAGSAYAASQLRWASSVERLEPFYEACARSARRTTAPQARFSPARLLAIAPAGVDAVALATLVERGFHGVSLAFEDKRRSALVSLGVPVCFRVGEAVAELDLRSSVAFAGAPFVVAANAHVAAALRLVDSPRALHVAAWGDWDGGSDSVIEIPPERDEWRAGAELVFRRLGLVFDDLVFRSVVFPSSSTLDGTYQAWMRKVVLQSLVRVETDAPFVFVDPGSAFDDEERLEAFLTATSQGHVEGAQRYYQSRGIALVRADLEAGID